MTDVCESFPVCDNSKHSDAEAKKISVKLGQYRGYRCHGS